MPTDSHRVPRNAFTHDFLTRLDQAREPDGAHEAQVAGPWAIRPVPYRGGTGFALLREWESVEEGDLPYAVFGRREMALLAAAVLPATGREPLFRLCTEPDSTGFPLRTAGPAAPPEDLDLSAAEPTDASAAAATERSGPGAAATERSATGAAAAERSASGAAAAERSGVPPRPAVPAAPTAPATPGATSVPGNVVSSGQRGAANSALSPHAPGAQRALDNGGAGLAGHLRDFDEDFAAALHLAAALVRSPRSLARLLEAAGYVALEQAGRILHRRIH